MPFIFDIRLSNNSDDPQTIEMFSSTNAVQNSESKKWRFTTPYIDFYTINTQFRALSGDVNYNFTITATTAPDGIVDILNSFDFGSWTLFASNVTDGNVFDVISPNDVTELEITTGSGGTGIGSMQIGTTFIVS